MDFSLPEIESRRIVLLLRMSAASILCWTTTSEVPLLVGELEVRLILAVSPERDSRTQVQALEAQALLFRCRPGSEMALASPSLPL